MHSGSSIRNHSSRSSGQSITGEYLRCIKRYKMQIKSGEIVSFRDCRPFLVSSQDYSEPYSRDALLWALRRGADRCLGNPLGPSLAWTLWFGKLWLVQALHWVDFTLLKKCYHKTHFILVLAPAGTPLSVLTQSPPPSSSPD